MERGLATSAFAVCGVGASIVPYEEKNYGETRYKMFHLTTKVAATMIKESGQMRASSSGEAGDAVYGCPQVVDTYDKAVLKKGWLDRAGRQVTDFVPASESKLISQIRRGEIHSAEALEIVELDVRLGRCAIIKAIDLQSWFGGRPDAFLPFMNIVLSKVGMQNLDHFDSVKLIGSIVTSANTDVEEWAIFDPQTTSRGASRKNVVVTNTFPAEDGR